MENTYFKLSRKKIKALFVYFGILLVFGLSISLIAINYQSISCNKLNVTIISLFGGIGTALLGSTIFYMRKLYKSAINNILSNPINEDEKINETGLFFYYLLRPVFAIVFSFLVHLGLKASVSIVTVKETSLDSGMIYLTMLMSFFIGFATGDVITKLEKVSKDVANKSIDKIS